METFSTVKSIMVTKPSSSVCQLILMILFHSQTSLFEFKVTVHVLCVFLVFDTLLAVTLIRNVFNIHFFNALMFFLFPNDLDK